MDEPYPDLAEAWRAVDRANDGRIAEPPPVLREAYTLLASAEPALIRAVDRAPNPTALHYQRLLLGRVQRWLALYVQRFK
jgi:hypothetical protein